MLSEFILPCLAASAITAIVTAFVTRLVTLNHQRTSIALDFEVKKSDLVESTKKSVASGEEFKNTLRNEYLRGRDEGQKAELQNFTIIYEPYQDLIEEYAGLKKRVEMGYDMQLYYSGLPIGQPTRRTTHKNIEFDKDRIDRIFDSELIGTLNNIAQLILNKGMNAKVLPKPSRK